MRLMARQETHIDFLLGSYLRWHAACEKAHELNVPSNTEQRYSFINLQSCRRPLYFNTVMMMTHLKSYEKQLVPQKFHKNACCTVAIAPPPHFRTSADVPEASVFFSWTAIKAFKALSVKRHGIVTRELYDPWNRGRANVLTEHDLK